MSATIIDFRMNITVPEGREEEGEAALIEELKELVLKHPEEIRDWIEWEYGDPANIDIERWGQPDV